MNRSRGATRYDQAAIRRAPECGESLLDLARIAHVDRAHLYPERRRLSLNGTELGATGLIGGISKNSCSLQARRDLLEQFQPFSACTVFKPHEAGRVAARLCQTRDAASTNRVGDGRAHNREGAT